MKHIRLFSGGAAAIGAAAIGAFAVGALAIGALALKKMQIQDATFNRVRIHELIVDNLTISKSSEG